MLLIKKAFKKIATFLAILLFINNTLTTFIFAEENSKSNIGSVLKIDKSAIDVENLSPVDEQKLSSQEKSIKFFNRLLTYYMNNDKNNGPKWLKNTSFSFMLMEDTHDPIYSLETIQPLSKLNSEDLWFFQGGYAHRNAKSDTLNLGIGWRKISSDGNHIVGLNSFFDYNFKNDISRMSLGIEYANKLAEFTANAYIPTSGAKEIDRKDTGTGILYSYERAVRGIDYEIGSGLKNIPWLKLFASGFHYDNKYKDDFKGYKLRTTAQLTSRLALEVGYIDSNESSDMYGKFTYNLADIDSTSLVSHDSNRKNELKGMLLRKVRRENDIKTETFTQFVAYIGGIEVTVNNSIGQPLQGAQVQILQNGNSIGQVSVTNAAGRAAITNLAAGTYTVNVTYFTHSVNSGVVTVQKDQISPVVINVPIAGGGSLVGHASVSVVTADLQPAAGIVVTAEQTDALQAKSNMSLFDTILGMKIASAANTSFTLSSTTQADGRAEFGNLPPGTYKFYVQDSDLTMWSDSVPIQSGKTSSTTIVLNADGGHISITVRDSNDQSTVSGALVELIENGVTVDSKYTNISGTTIFSNLSSLKTYNVRIMYNGLSQISSSIASQEGKTIEQHFWINLTSSVDITVTDGVNPLAGANVTINGQTVTTNASGVATFSNVPTGTHSVTVSFAGYGTINSSITVTTGTTVSPIISLTHDVGNVNITVTDGANPLQGASVTLNGQTVTTNASGIATFSNVPTGTHSVIISLAGYGTINNSVTVTASSTISPTISLSHDVGNVNITVTDGTNPLQGASVTLNGQTVTTNASGIATFSNVPTGTHSVTISLAGYGTINSSVTVTASSTISPTISLSHDVGNVDITVTDGTNPLQGASVTLNGQTVTTNASGVASFTNVPTGTHNVTVSLAGYGTINSSVAVIASSTISPTISLTHDVGNVSITVTDGSNPLQGASVTLNGQTVLTNASGIASFTNVPTGTHSVTVSLASYGTINSSVTVTASSTTSSTISLIHDVGNVSVTVNDGTLPLQGASVTLNGQTVLTNASGIATFSNVPTGTHSVTVSLASYGTINGSVTVTTGATVSPTISLTHDVGNVSITVNDGTLPLQGASVTLNGQTVLTNASGIATFSNVPTGTHNVTVSFASYGTINGSVTVTTGATVSPTISLTHDIGNVNITVTDGTNPLQGANVTLNGQTVTTDASGIASFTNIPTGTHSVTVSLAGYGTINSSVTVIASSTISPTISLTHDVGNVSITVTDGSNPLQGANVTLNGQTVTTNSSGIASFSNVPTGTHNVMVSLASYGTINSSVTVTTGSTVSPTISLTHDVGNVSITVTDGSNPLQGASVNLNGQAVITDASGIATFSNVPTGTHNVTVSLANYGTINSSVTVTTGTTISPTVSLTHDVGNVSITVTDGSNPIQGASVTLNGQTVLTNASGVASFSNIPTGTHNVTVSLTSYGTINSSVTITTGATVSPTISLTHDVGNVSITVTDGSNPLQGASVTLNGQTVTTDASGIATFNNVPTGTHSVAVSLAGYGTINSSVTVMTGTTISPTISLTHDVGNVNITVTDGSNPLQGASVTLNGQTILTNASGIASFTNIPTGTHNVTVSLASYGTINSSVIVTTGTTVSSTISLTHDVGNVSITVTDGSNPLQGASVTLNGQTVTTNASGIASFSDIPTGTHNVTVSLASYGTINSSVTVTIGATVSSTISLTHDVGNVSITVNDGTLSLQGASVTLNGQTILTNTSGVASFSNIPTGTHNVTVSLANYGTINSSVTVTASSTTSSTISLTHDVGNVSITVTDGSSPLQGASVTLNGQTVTSDAFGIATFSNVPTGTHSVTVSFAGYGTINSSVTVTTSTTVSPTISLTHDVGNVSITVTDGSNPLQGASVTLNGQTVLTNASGIASFTNIPTGTHSVMVSLASYGTINSSVTVTTGATVSPTISLTHDVGNVSITVNDGTLPLQGASVTLNGQTVLTNASGIASFTNVPTGTHNVTVSLVSYGTINSSVTVTTGATSASTISLTHDVGNVSITVTDGSSPLSGASVTLNGQTVLTNVSGIATFSNVPTGTHSVTISLASYGTINSSVTVTTGTTVSPTISLTHDVGNVSITVTDGTNPLQGASVTLNGQTVTTNASGIASFTNIPTGTHSVIVSLASYGTINSSVTVTTGTTISPTISLTHDVGNVSITVTDGTNPLQGASVTLNGQTVTTDTSGIASFTNIPTGTHSVTVSLASYGTINSSVTVTASSTTSSTISLIHDVGNVSVTVNDGTLPLQGASVTLNGQTVLTNASGIATFSNVPTGTHSVTVSLASYGTINGSVTVTTGATVSPTISLTHDVGNVSITVNDGTLPLHGASVTLNGQTVTTNSSGIATFSNVPTGTHNVTVSLANYGTIDSSVTVTASLTTNSTISLTHDVGNVSITVTDGSSPLQGASVTLNGQTILTNASGIASFTNIPTGTHNVTVSLASYGTINSSVIVTTGTTVSSTISLTHDVGNVSITVTDGSNPLQGASVTLNGQTVTTNASGIASFSDIPTGTHNVTVSLASYGTINSSVTVTTGTTVSPTISLTHDVGNVSITVTDGTNPLQGASVTLNGQTVTTNASGIASFTNIPTGTHSVMVSLASYGTINSSVTVTTGTTISPTISLTHDVGNVSITVTDGTNPLQGASVTLNGQTVTTNASGIASFTNIPTGTHSVMVSLASYGTINSSVTVTTGTTISPTISLTHDVGNVSITVNDGTLPLQGASVTLNGQTVTTNASGIATFSNVPTGTHGVIVSLASYGTINSSVTVTTGATVSPTISLTHDVGNVSITVTDGTNPLQGASVTLNGQTVTTNASGIASFTNIPTGTHSVMVSLASYGTINSSVTVTTGTTISPTISLTHDVGNVSITVTDGTNPLQGASVTLNGQTVTTNASGIASFTNIPTGTHSVTVSLASYGTINSSVIVTTGTTVSSTISLTHDVGNVSITVNDGTLPLQGASVTLNGQTVLTNASGIASFTNVPTGTHNVTVSLVSYGTINSSVTVTTGATSASTISLTHDVGNVTITVKEGLALLLGANVTLNGQTVVTNALGVASFTNVPTGTYNVAVSLTGYGTINSNVTVTTGVTITPIISLIRDVGNVTITVKEGSALLLGASVTLNGQTVVTNALGVASFTNVPTGTYNVAVSLTGYGTINSSVTVTTGATISPIISLIRDVGNVTITVKEGLALLLGANVTLNGQTVVTNALGVASFTNVPTGTYNVAVSLTGYGTINSSVTVTTGATISPIISLIRDVGNVTITVKEGSALLLGASVTLNGQTVVTDALGVASFTNVPTGTYNVAVSLTGYGTINSNVTVTTGVTITPIISLIRDVGNVTITVKEGLALLLGASVTLNGQTVVTNALGVASFTNVPTGTYNVAVSLTGYGTINSNVTVTTGVTITPIISLIRDVGNVTITVKEGSALLLGASVTLNGQTVVTNALGVASFTNVPTGTYNVAVSLTDYGTVNSSVTVTTGATSTSTISLIHNVGNVSITVNDGSAALQGASVTLNGQTVTTNASGIASFTGVPTGNYVANVSRSGYTSGSTNVTVTNGTTTNKTVSLTGLGGVTITVYKIVSLVQVPLQGASVTLNGQTLTTNAAGQVTFTNVPVGINIASVSMPGYVTGAATVTILLGITIVTNVTLLL